MHNVINLNRGCLKVPLWKGGFRGILKRYILIYPKKKAQRAEEL